MYVRVALCVRFVAARDAETRRARQQQPATAAAALQARHEETTRLAGEYKGDCVTSNFSVEGTAVAMQIYIYIYRFSMFVDNVSLLRVILRLRFVAARDTETRRARQQQQANENAAAEAALQARHEETTRRAGNYNGGSRNAKFYSAVVLCTKFLNSGIRRMPVGVFKDKSERIYIF